MLRGHVWLVATAQDSGVLGHRKDLAYPREDSQQRRADSGYDRVPLAA